METIKERPIIALLGRPNVGKSTVFNRLIGRRQAITSFQAGTTRDRHFGVMHWFGHSWTLVDTAGIIYPDESEENVNLEQAIKEQIDLAINNADVLAVVVDVKAGIHPQDRRIITELRKHNKPLVILANKADNHSLRLQIGEFEQLGAKTIFAVSAIHGTGMNDLIDYLITHKPSPDSTTIPELSRVSIIGRPNVGKSTLINTILSEKRLVVSEVPGTTRDTIANEITLPGGTKFNLIDTAGIRRRGKIEAGIETYSLFRTLRTINQSDLVILLLSIEEVPTRGDVHVAMYALEAKKKLIILLNKIDLAKDDILGMKSQKQHNLGQKFLRRFPFLQRMPYFFISAENGAGIEEFLTYLGQEIKSLRGL